MVQRSLFPNLWLVGLPWESHMNLIESTRHLCFLNILLVNIVYIAPSAAKVESEAAPGFLLGGQHLGDVISVVCVREGTPHWHSSAHPELVDVGLCLEEVELGGSDGGYPPSSRLGLLDHWNRHLWLLWVSEWAREGGREGLRRVIDQRGSR